MVSEVDIERASIVVPTRPLSWIRKPSFFSNMDLTRVKHGDWQLVSGSVSFSEGVLTLYNASQTSELKSTARTALYGVLLIYAKLGNANSIIGLDDGNENYIRVTDGKLQVKNAQTNTTESANVTLDLNSYHQYLLVWSILGSELWIDGVLMATLLAVSPQIPLPVRLCAPSGGYLYVNTVGLHQDNPNPIDPLGSAFFPKDINSLIPRISPTGRVLWQDPMSNAGVPKVENWWMYWDGTTPAPSTANETAQDKAFMNGQSIRVETKAEANKFSGIARNFPKLRAKRIGFEIWFAIEEYTNLEYLAMMIDRYDVNGYDAALVFYEFTSAIAGRWKYATGSSSTYPPSTTQLWTQWLYYSMAYGGKPNRPLYWHHAKLVTDFDAGKYISFECDDKVSEIDGVDLRTIDDFRYTNPVEAEIIDVAFEIRSKAAAVVKAWLGCAIVTEEETE